ncbi:MAG TPA: ThuA domain-containing protein [Woeseiaceae bacterium]|nr:ThuA domain-containing protein [Woeseiaceae bacterium]
MSAPEFPAKLFQLLSIFVFSLLLALPAFAADNAGKVLFTYGGWDGHEPEAMRDLLVPWLESEGFEVIVSDTLEPYADAALMSDVDLVVQIWTMGEITEPQLEGLLNAVENGVGIAGWHGGLGDAFRRVPRYQYMIGGQWVEHPGNDGIRYRVNITDREDPVTAGLEDFDVISEQYYMHVDPNNKVLATTTFDGEHDSWVKDAVMPVVWKRIYGDGRVFYTSLGHQSKVFETAEALTILKRGMLWASRSKYENTPNLVVPVYPAAR